MGQEKALRHNNASSSSHATKIHAAAICLLACLCIITPIAIAWFHMGAFVIFNLFTGDSMYYLAIANNYLKLGFPSFDGAPSNGFHPLWECILIILFKLTAVTHHHQLYAVFFLCITLTCAAYGILGLAFMRVLGFGQAMLALLLLFPGAYTALIAPQRHHFDDPGMLYMLTPVSAIDGMETPLLLFLWAIFLFFLMTRFFSLHTGVHPSLKTYFPLSCNICLAFLILARLDDGLALVAIGVFLLCQKGCGFKEKISALLHVAWPSMIALAIYFSYNLGVIGVALPVSGMMKISLLEAHDHTLERLIAGNYSNWWYGATRLYPVLFSFVVALLCLFIAHRRGETNAVRQLLLLAGFFLVLKSIFLFLWVPVFNQGYWYYFSMILITNVIAAFALGYACRQPSQLKLALAISVCVVLFKLPNDVNFLTARNEYPIQAHLNFDHPEDVMTRLSYADIAYMLWLHDDALRDYLSQNAPNIPLIDNFDGMYGYFLDMPAQSITGLASSPDEINRRISADPWRSIVEKEAIMPGFGYVNPYDIEEISIVKRLQPSMLPVAFYIVRQKS